MLENAYSVLYIGSFLTFGILILMCLIRAIKGPRVTDRLVTGNMIATIVIMVIAILSAKMKEGYLVDVCLVYAMVSFVANVVLSRVFIKNHDEKKEKEEKINGMD